METDTTILALIDPSDQPLETTSKNTTGSTDVVESSKCIVIQSPMPDVSGNNNELVFPQPKIQLHPCWELSLWKLDDAANTVSTTNDGTKSQTSTSSNSNDCLRNVDIVVDIIIPVHNASSTIRETIVSAMSQIWHTTDLSSVSSSTFQPNITIHVCCYNDASTDDSWHILQELYDTYATKYPHRQQTLTGTTDSNDGVGARCGRSYAISTQLWISSSPPNSIARGPGYARNQAVQMRETIIASQCAKSINTIPIEQHFICWLDSDDIMHPLRIYYQVHTMMQLPSSERLITLLGTNFDRFITTGVVSAPETITPHYTKWANELSHERLYLERFREVTIIQPTWMMCRYRFTNIIHGYLECPFVVDLSGQVTSIHCNGQSNERLESDNISKSDDISVSSIHGRYNERSFSEWIQHASLTQENKDSASGKKSWRLVHTEIETLSTVRVAEDLRFFHEHLYYGGLLRRATLTSTPLVSYRHRPGISQSALTSRKLLLALRVAAFEQMILNKSHSQTTDGVWKNKFIIWGAGRDGKDFFKALSPHGRERVYCFVDVDDAKIARGFYNYSSPTCSNAVKKQRTEMNIPIIHFSLATQDPERRSRLYNSWKRNDNVTNDANDPFVHTHYGRIVKNQETNRIDDTSQTATSALPQAKRMKATPEDMVAKADPGTNRLDVSLLPDLPVVVCVAMYRTNGALESNVELINRTEGKDLWYFA